MGRPRKYATSAERQRAYRRRVTKSAEMSHRARPGGRPPRLTTEQRASLGSEVVTTFELKRLAWQYGVSRETIMRAILRNMGFYDDAIPRDANLLPDRPTADEPIEMREAA